MSLAALLDTSIRLVTIIIRGVFIFAAVRYLGEKDFGIYVIISAVIALMQYIVAGDFSYIAHRELLAGRVGLQEVLKTQSILLVGLFIMACPITFFILNSLVDPFFIGIVFVILFLESTTSELQRHLVVISKFTRANLMLFMKSAGWMAPVLIVLFFNESLRNINLIVLSWTLGLVVSLTTGLMAVSKDIPSDIRSNMILLNGYFRTVPIILVGTIATRSLFSLDRILIEKLVGLEYSGIYGLYVGLAAGFVAVLDAGILSRSYPKLVMFASNNLNEFKVLSKHIQMKIGMITLIAIIIYNLTINFFLLLVSKINYIEYLYTGSLLIAGYGIYSLSFPLNCRLYALGMDKEITIINLLALTPILSTFVLGDITLEGMASAVLLAAIFHYVLRIKFMARLNFGK